MTSVEQLVSAMSGRQIVDVPHPSEQLKIWHSELNDWVLCVDHTCMYCNELVKISDVGEYFLLRRNGDSFYGYEAHHYLCAKKAIHYAEQ